MKDSKPCDDTGNDNLVNSFKSLLSAQLLFGKELIKMVGATTGMVGSLYGLKLPKKDCCKIPDPCWMPLSHGEIQCSLKRGDKGTACLVITNGDFRPHTYQFVATGKNAAAVSFSTTSTIIGPKERIAVTATFTVPNDNKVEDCDCIDYEALIWVQGCHDHYLRWTINEVACSKPCCHKVIVDDNPDDVLHWYDHFYMPRRCFGGSGQKAVPQEVSFEVKP